jgi:hypothetical protein
MNNNINSELIEMDRNSNIEEMLQNETENYRLSLVKYIKERDYNNEKSALDLAVDDILNYNKNNPNSSFETDNLDKSDEIIEEIKNENYISLFDIVKQVSHKIEGLGKYIEESKTPLSEIIKNISSSELNDKVTTIINKVKDELSVQKESIKPLGNYGEVSLNEVMNRLINNRYVPFKDAVEVAVNVGGLIPVGLVYSGIVKLYLKKINPYSEIIKETNPKIRMQALALRRKEMLLFMGAVAPIAAVTLVFFGKVSVGDLINITVHSSETNNLTSELFSLGLMTRLIFKKLPNWFKYLFVLLTLIFVFKSNLYLYLLPYITIKSLKYFWLFLLLNTIVYFSFNYIFLTILNQNKNFKIPKNLPRFIINQIESLKLLSTTNLYNRDKKRNKLLIIICLIVFILAILII